MTRCAAVAWLFGWVTAVFVPSAAIALFGLSDLAGGTAADIGQLPGATWRIADEVGPIAKLAMGALLMLAFWGGHALTARGPIALSLLATMVLGALALLLLAAALPVELSRGFAAGIAGQRFDPALLAAYLGGGAIAGAVFTISHRRCGARLSEPR